MNSLSYSKNFSLNLFSYFKYLYGRRHEDLLYYKRYNELRKIIKNERLDTFFQPIVNLKTGETFAFEALNRPSKSQLFSSVDLFYEFVGKTDRIFEFEKFCRNLSLKRYISRLETDGLDNRFSLFINIHPHVLLDKNYHGGETLRLLKELGIQPDQVIFEITERSAVTDFKEFERVLSNYRSQGYRIAIDDVGSGYNSLKTIIYLKPEFIKLDRSLIQNIDQSDAGQQLISLIYNYAEQSGTTGIIAEGIERPEEIQTLQSIGIHYGQGYAIGRPKMELKRGEFR
ncbi:EAL domain-containing protein (putative c-di-GMP-specific phosphodiesterase class I) [Ureibacillus xyleni]|uniref:EAL domain-containing protein (Putative c-di-GMP-specific phosphodiesterase class I) n=1 Tax=Ureibacillus xyleni TaxID=614648 RepID=A0A285T954_9BACL|nr:EAL domain-containing protein [Ureibacillus xyleni]SOC18089.1 EAL domain-containing protein (putative c-di-GMP-specific phosphodiesterase class I) [Ureibacillus xyleni]